MIYLDHLATTPCDPSVVEAMLPYFANIFGNPASPHSMGETAASAVAEARDHIASLLSVEASEVVFTSGATESNNLAILGIANAYLPQANGRSRIVTTMVEHKSVSEPIKHLEKMGWSVDYLPVDSSGRVILDSIHDTITESTLLVSVQLANSEIGTIQPITAIAELAREHGAIMHCDASQAVGKIAVRSYELNVDLLSFSAHKMYGPKGIGALWIRMAIERAISPLLFGGMSSDPIRPGTSPVPLIVGFGKAAELSNSQLTHESKQISDLRNVFEAALIAAIPTLIINGSLDARLPNLSSITFPLVDAEAMLANLQEIIASTGSACESGTPQPSRVLKTIGLTDDQSYSTIRFGLGRFTTRDEIQNAAKAIIKTYFNLLPFYKP